MNDLDQKLAELRILETKFAVWLDKLGIDNAHVQLIKSELDQANSSLYRLMVIDQERRIQESTL